MAAGQPSLTVRPRAAVLGSPVRHSLSPVLHRAAYAQLGLDWRYDAVEVDEAGLPALLGRLDSSWRGLSLTMPLKRAVIELCDTVSARARQVNAVNTVLLAPDGRRTGENTDVPGIVRAVSLRAHVESIGGVGILGGGATAGSAVGACAVLGVPAVAAVRSPGRHAELRSVADATGADLRLVPWSDVSEVMTEDLVISTIPAGASSELASSVPAAVGVLLDVVYSPWPTPLAQQWQRRGLVLGGLDLLVQQAVLQVELMTGQRPSWERMWDAGAAALAQRGG